MDKIQSKIISYPSLPIILIGFHIFSDTFTKSIFIAATQKHDTFDY